jgi:hypothetical protein
VPMILSMHHHCVGEGPWWRVRMEACPRRRLPLSHAPDVALGPDRYCCALWPYYSLHVYVVMNGVLLPMRLNLFDACRSK